MFCLKEIDYDVDLFIYSFIYFFFQSVEDQIDNTRQNADSANVPAPEEKVSI